MSNNYFSKTFYILIIAVVIFSFSGCGKKGAPRYTSEISKEITIDNNGLNRES